MKESDFQRNLKKEILKTFPGAKVKKMDTDLNQGWPDLLILCGKRWAMLECKKSEYEYLHDQRPNQDYFVNLFNKMSFARFIYPENKKEVLNELYELFRTEQGT